MSGGFGAIFCFPTSSDLIYFLYQQTNLKVLMRTPRRPSFHLDFDPNDSSSIDDHDLPSTLSSPALPTSIPIQATYALCAFPAESTHGYAYSRQSPTVQSLKTKVTPSGYYVDNQMTAMFSVNRSVSSIALSSIAPLDSTSTPNSPMFSPITPSLGYSHPFGYGAFHNMAQKNQKQACFTIADSNPWKLIGANDLAVLHFGVVRQILKNTSILDLVSNDYSSYLKFKLMQSKAQLQLCGLGGSPSCLNFGLFNNKEGIKPYRNRDVLVAGEVIKIKSFNHDINNNDHKDNETWASVWIKRKQGFLIGMIDLIPCDEIEIKLLCNEQVSIINMNDSLMNIFNIELEHEQQHNYDKIPFKDLLPTIPYKFSTTNDKSLNNTKKVDIDLEQINIQRFYTGKTENGANIPIAVMCFDLNSDELPPDIQISDNESKPETKGESAIVAEKTSTFSPDAEIELHTETQPNQAPLSPLINEQQRSYNTSALEEDNDTHPSPELFSTPLSNYSRSSSSSASSATSHHTIIESSMTDYHNSSMSTNESSFFKSYPASNMNSNSLSLSLSLSSQYLLKISSLPYISGMVLIQSSSSTDYTNFKSSFSNLSQSSNKLFLNKKYPIISCNRAVMKNLFGQGNVVGLPIHNFIPYFETYIKNANQIIKSQQHIETENHKLNDIVNHNIFETGLVLSDIFFRKSYQKIKQEQNKNQNGNGNYNDENLSVNGIPAIHADGSKILINLQLRIVTNDIWALWITYDRELTSSLSKKEIMEIHDIQLPFSTHHNLKNDVIIIDDDELINRGELDDAKIRRASHWEEEDSLPIIPEKREEQDDEKFLNTGNLLKRSGTSGVGLNNLENSLNEVSLSQTQTNKNNTIISSKRVQQHDISSIASLPTADSSSTAFSSLFTPSNKQVEAESVPHTTTLSHIEFNNQNTNIQHVGLMPVSVDIPVHDGNNNQHRHEPATTTVNNNEMHVNKQQKDIGIDINNNNDSTPTNGNNNDFLPAPLVLFQKQYSNIKEIGLNRRTKRFKDYNILKEMGQGAYGKAVLAQLKTNPFYIVVIKLVIKARILVDTWVRDKKLGTVPSEIQIMNFLNEKLKADDSKYIIKLVDFFEDDEFYYIESEPAGDITIKIENDVDDKKIEVDVKSTDLFDIIEKNTEMNEKTLRSIFKQICVAVQNLHSIGVVHRDIKDENIILDSENNVRLIDFGSAAMVKKGPFDIFVGTIDYAAPEVLKGKSYEGKPQDIWALGILLYTMVYRENPFYNIDEIIDGELRMPFILNDLNSNLIKKILQRDIKKRPNITEILNDPWFNEDLGELPFTDGTN